MEEVSSEVTRVYVCVLCSLAVVSLYLMSQWVGSSELATPTQQHRAKQVSSLSCPNCMSLTMAPFQMVSRLQNRIETETCPICRTCIFTTN